MKTLNEAHVFRRVFYTQIRNSFGFNPSVCVGGSCMLNGKGEDIDLFVLNFNGADKFLRDQGYIEDGDYVHPENFKSYRFGEYNVILCSEKYFNACFNVVVLFNTCRESFKDTLTKEQRIRLYETIRGFPHG